MKRNMKIKTIFEITDADIDFIGAVTSSWHFDNLIAFVKYKNLRKGVLILVPQSNMKDDSRYRISDSQVKQYGGLFEQVIKLSGERLRGDGLNILRQLPSLWRRNGRPLYILNTFTDIGFISLLPCLKRKYIGVWVDEGIGRYMSKEAFVKTQVNTNYDDRYIPKLKKQIKRFVSDFLIHNKIEFFLYEKKDNLLFLNPTVAENLKQVYTDRVVPNNDTVKNVIYFKDYNVVSDKIHTELLNKIIPLIVESGCQLIIKKHPNDINSSFDEKFEDNSDVKILRNTISGEELVVRAKPEVIISGFSTVTFSSGFIFDIPVVSTINLYKQHEELDDLNRSLIDEFYAYFNHNANLLFPNNEEVLLADIKKNIVNYDN